VVAAARPIKVTDQFQPHLGVGGSDVEELVGFWFLGAVGVAAVATTLGILVLPLLPRFVGGCFVAIEEPWRLLYRSLLRQRSPKLLRVLMQVGVVAFAAGPVLTTEVARGVSPGDVPSSSSRSRRPRRVATAATSTRRGPLKVRSGDLAAASEGFVSPSGEVELLKMAAADHRGARGLDCFSSFFLGFVLQFWDNCPSVWLVPVFSCSLLNIIRYLASKKRSHV
jgi:hypothetical protein